MPGLKLKAELGGDGSGFDAMMKRANAAKDKFGASFAGLKSAIAGAFTVGAITSLANKTIDLAGHLRDVSDALKVNVEWFQKRSNAAKLAGGSEDDLAKFLDTMTKNREEAFNKPGGEQAQRFGRLGFSQQDISGLNTMDFFDRIVKAFGDGANAQTAVDVENVGGKAARNLLAAFSNGFEGEGSIMSEDIINQLDDIGDQFTILGNILMVELAPAIVAVANAARELINLPKQTGSGIGRGIVAAQIGVQEDKNSGVGYLKRAINFWPNFWKGFTEGVVSEEADQNELKAGEEAAKAKAKELRKRRERSGPGFTPLELTTEKKQKERGPTLSTDSLVGIGNFLGRNPQLVNSVANQQLAVARQQLEVLQSINRGNKMGKKDYTIENIQVPSG